VQFAGRALTNGDPVRKLLVLLTTVVAVEALSGLTTASGPPVVATGTWTVSQVPDTPVEFVPQGQQCLVRAQVMVVYTGTLEGVTTSVGPQGNLWFATCDELLAGGVGIPLVYQAVEHFVGADGNEATFHSSGRIDAAGVLKGTSSLVGDLHGVIHLTGSAETGTGTYEGRVVRG
jgi:hypothetical protein